MIYHDMGEAELSQFLTNDDTGWLALSGAILESSQGFPDTTFIEGKHPFLSSIVYLVSSFFPWPKAC